MTILAPSRSAGRLLLTGWLLTAAAVASPREPAVTTFQSARPIWPTGREKEKNLTVAFRACFPTTETKDAILRVTGHALYRVYANGKFAGHGPARAGHGFYRVDEWPLASHLVSGTNTVVVEVAGYNANSYYLLDQPSFLQAEIVAAGKVIASTAGAGIPFEAAVVTERLQKVQRYSFQRPFSEVWRLTPGHDRYRSHADAPFQKVPCTVQETKPRLPRRVPYPQFTLRPPVQRLSSGSVRKTEIPKQIWKDRSLTAVGPALAGFPESELVTIPSIELQAVQTVSSVPNLQPWASHSTLSLTSNSFHIVDFGVNYSGFLGAHIRTDRPTRLFLTFDEILTGDDVDFKRLGCVNAVLYDLSPGEYRVESFEPYTLRYLKLIVLEGACDVSNLYLREYVNPEATRAEFSSSDAPLNRIFTAARETFQQNAVDVFMDCPSRERAGWLCDSYFTARVALDLCGTTTVEKNFLENYLLPSRFEHLPEGMLPMCYPADHHDGVFIPNWALWFVLELEEYLDRSGDRELVDALRPRVLRLLELFRTYENADGLLEKLPSWVFIEWSKANDFTQDVNYPSNMLYARALAAAAHLYQLPDLARKAESLRALIRQQSFDGEFFVDHALRHDGRLEIARDRSEVCQYFAFFFEIATPQSHPKLWQILTTDFGPQRKETKAHPEIHPANAFIGNQLRFELLSRYERGQQILDEAIGYWLYMADRTGTLWENDGAYASCNHGFAAHAAHVFLRDVLGLHRVDPVNRTLQLRFSDVRLDSCQGSVPTADGPIRLRWNKDTARLAYRLECPRNWKVSVRNLTGRELVEQKER